MTARSPRTARRRHLVAAAAAVAASATVAASTTGAATAEAADVPCGCSVYFVPSPGAPDPVHAVNQLGARLLGPLGEADPGGNLVYSPFSVAVALTMASAGAQGETLMQMQDVLALGGVDPHSALATIVAAVTDEGDGTLSMASSLWAQDGVTIEAAFADVLADWYDADLMLTDFADDPDAARDAVNDWVAEHTADRIPELLVPNVVDAMTRFILVNAIHLDADWQHPFDPASTRPDDFTTADGATVEVDTMHQTLDADYHETAGLQAVTLPYADGYEMVVVLPGEGALDELEQQLADAGGDLDSVVGPASAREVQLSLPTWDIETVTSLADALRALGMTGAFDPDVADFSGITTDEPIVVSDVIHQANITVAEDGTEAAAATAVVMDVAAAPPDGDEPEPVVVDVDRPFFFAIRSQSTGAVLFQGHVTDPS